MAVNRWSALSLIGVTIAIVACQQPHNLAMATGDPDHDAVFTADGPLSATIGKTVDGKPLVAVAAPPGVDASLITPHKGDVLDRAMLPLEKILPEIRRPAYLPKAAAPPAGNLDPAAKIEQRISELKAVLKEKPNDRAAATELLRLHLIEKDDPASALPLLELGADLKTRVHLPLATKPMGDLKEGELLDLAIWYQEIGNRTQSAGGEKMLRKAYQYYEAFIKAHPAEDIQNATARVALMKVHQSLEARAAGTAKPRGPSLHVQRTYARARAAWRDGQPHVAVNMLEAANGLAPNQVEILRMLGQIYFGELRNAVQGAHYTKQVLALEPNDLDTIFLLGKHEFLNLRNWNNAIAVFSHALAISDADTDSAVPLLAHHYLGRALQNEGYDAASIAQFEKFLDVAATMARPTRYLQEVSLFTRTLPIAWQQVGDAHHRLNNPEAALVAYEEAIKLDPDASNSMVSRLAYTRLRLGRADEALKNVVDLIKSTNGSQESLALLNYLVATGVNANRLTGELKRIYEQVERPAPLALALATMQGGVEGRKTLREHVLAKPTDREVFQNWLEKTFESSDKAAAAVEAIRLTSELITKVPTAAERYGDLLIDAAPSPDLLITAAAALTADEQGKPIVRLLKAMALLRADKTDEAIEEFSKAAAADPSLIAAQASLIKLLVDREEFDRASKALAGIKDGNDPRILPLRVRVLRETNKTAEAIALIDTLTPEQRRNPEIVLEKATLQLLTGEVGSATRTLEEGLDSNPTSEPLYEALLDLLDSHETPEAQRQALRITERMLRQIPRSTFAQVRKAQLFIRNRDIESAETVLRDVQKEHPTDVRSLALLTQVLFFTDRKGDADELINARLQAHPRSEEVVAVALQLVRMHLQSGSATRSVELTTKLLDHRAAISDPRTLVMLHRLATIRTKKFDDIDTFYKKVVDAYPKHWADLMSDWALSYEYAGQKPKSEAILEQVLAKEPGHAKTNNALGYSWADQGKNLERAEKMIEIALKEDPDSSAYLDSMGWVKYKLGKFDEAVKFLEQAANEDGGDHAVILDHLGDALYRAGRKNDAIDWWNKAQQSIDPAELDVDLELKSVAAKLREKISAVRAGKEPTTAEVPAKVDKKD